MSEAEKTKRPILAILTMDDNKQYFRGNIENFIDIIKTGRKFGFTVYLVTVRDLNLQAKRVSGYCYQDNNVWVLKWFPLPDIIYNRIPLREDENLPIVRHKIKEIISCPSIHLFNPYFFNKWYLFQWLIKCNLTKKYIPATKKLSTTRSLRNMLLKYPYLFLKPACGKAGVGIMTLHTNHTKVLKFRLQVQTKKRSISYKCTSVTKLWQRISKEVATHNYIIQQGISLVANHRRPFDLRVLIQKNGVGKWEVTGIGARIAGTSSITTHIPRGGSIDDPEKLLIPLFGLQQAKKIITRVQHVALIIARQIEHSSGHLHGEMSMDLGVDTTGQIWFFEANSKPMKFDEPHIRKHSLERIFQYSKYLIKIGG